MSLSRVPLRFVFDLQKLGHGSIPYGAASELAGPQREGVVNWYETKLADDPDVPKRVLNGFVKLVLDGPNLTEELTRCAGC